MEAHNKAKHLSQRKDAGRTAKTTFCPPVLAALELQMIEKPKLLSVVTNPDGDVIHVHADLSGLQKLRNTIDSMITKLESDECEHEHLRTEDWAGYELTASMLESEKKDGCTQVHHVKVYAWNPEWKNKHEL